MKSVVHIIGALGVASALVSVVASATPLTPVQAKQQGSGLTENEAFDRCVTTINLIGKRPVDTVMPRINSQTNDGQRLFKWKTQSGFINCQISNEKKGRLSVFSSKD